MGTVAPSFLDPTTAEMFHEGRALISSPVTLDGLARRVRQRRQMHLIQACSYSLGALDLLLFAYGGFLLKYSFGKRLEIGGEVFSHGREGVLPPRKLKLRR